ncbi:MAG: hypothetical protein N2171_05120 [Clostridia bacterium]|nr:hypothetical protein [Clostridia bacterium]
MNNTDHGDIPLGLGMALAQNPDAMMHFSTFSFEKKQKVLEHVHTINSKHEMQEYVNQISKNLV